MKSINLKYFLSLFLTLVLLTSNVQSLKKSESVMGFLNDLFLTNEEQETSPKNQNIHNQETKKTENKNHLSLNMEGYLRIKSEEFTNENKFPSLTINGKTYKVKTDSNGFRINDFNKNHEHSSTPNLEFYFRIIKNLVYYTINKNDVNVLGSFTVLSVKDKTHSSNKKDSCFTVNDVHGTSWILCADTNEMRKTWVCKIHVALGNVKSEIYCVDNSIQKSQNTVTVFENQELNPVLIVPVPTRNCNQGWNYKSNGSDWECLCSEGSEQSPIDIPQSKAKESPVSPLFKFENIPAKSLISTIDGELKSEEYIKIKYFDNSIRILHYNLGKIVTLDGSVFTGEEIVFHTPSEHKINGKTFDMEMQLIYYAKSNGDIAKQVILSFLFVKTPGVYNKFLDDLDFFSLPNAKNPERDIVNDLFIPKVFLASNEELDSNFKPFSFYTYNGSLTMPPCNEQTTHFVVSEPIPLASVPIQLFQEAIRSADNISDDSNVELGKNNRDVQPLNGRPVFYYDKNKFSLPYVLEIKDNERKSTASSFVKKN